MPRRRSKPDPWSALLDFTASPDAPADPEADEGTLSRLDPASEQQHTGSAEPLAPGPLFTSSDPSPSDPALFPGVPLPAPKRGGRPRGKSRHIPPYPTLSAVRGMWLFAMFDLPVDTRAARRNYTQFRKSLLGEGFTMLQFSVYALYCSSEEVAEKYRRRVRSALPPHGQVRVLAVTDLQFGKMEVYLGKSKSKPEGAPDQLVLF